MSNKDSSLQSRSLKNKCENRVIEAMAQCVITWKQHKNADQLLKYVEICMIIGGLGKNAL